MVGEGGVCVMDGECVCGGWGGSVCVMVGECVWWLGRRSVCGGWGVCVCVMVVEGEWGGGIYFD